MVNVLGKKSPFHLCVVSIAVVCRKAGFIFADFVCPHPLNSSLTIQAQTLHLSLFGHYQSYDCLANSMFGLGDY